MLLLSAMTLIVAYQVFTRYVLGFSSSLLQALVLVFLVALGIIGISLGFRSDSHIAVGVFYRLFPRPVRTVIDVVVRFLILAVGVLLLVKGIVLFKSGVQAVIPGTSLPLSVMYLCMPITGTLTIVYGLRSLSLLFGARPDRESEED
jgi:TRAP-type C4-dicarboxylate transport system permease small subunit